MKSRKFAFALFAGFALIAFGYFFYCVNYLISDTYTVINGASLNTMLPLGIYPHEDTLEAGVGGELRDGVAHGGESSRTVTLKVFNLVPVKEVSVNTVDAPLVYPSGECIGIKMYSRGLIVSGFTDFETENGICVSPGAAAGLKTGDIIISIDGIQTSSVKEFSLACDRASGLCSLEVERDGKTLYFKVAPERCADGHMRMGIYVKNSIAGVGTMTYVTGDNMFFGALGHGISDYGSLVPMESGTVYKADVIDIKKGEKGIPGEVIGAIGEDMLMGQCTSNTNEGIYGVVNSVSCSTEPMEAAPSSEIQRGKATILCTVDTDDRVEEYDVEIISVNRLSQNKTKSFSIRVTDEDLARKTGGIVQGMSGSPIIQNGRIVGAVTHVFVNDPTRGYGIFIENMLAEAEKIK